MGLWDYGIMGLWDYGIMGLWDYGIMGLFSQIPATASSPKLTVSYQINT